jgi:hypothetical protein
MSSKTNFKHTVSTTEPSKAGNLGDEWFNPSTNKWYKLLATSGTTVAWTEVNAATATSATVSAGLTAINGNVSIPGNVVAAGYYTTGNASSQLAATGNLTVTATENIILIPISGNVITSANVFASSYYTTGNASSQLAATGNLTITATENIIFIPGANSTVIGAGAGGGSGLFNTSITNSINYLATNTLANAVVFTAKSILHSVYITNINSAGNANVGVTATINFAPLLWNMPLPYRSSFEALKKPKIVNAGDSLRVQGLIQGVGANSNVHATIVYEEISSGTYTGINSNIAVASANVDVFTATGASIIESVMVSSTNNLGNVPVTVTITDSSNVIQGYMAYTLLVPIGATIELCEKPRRIATGHKLQAYTNAANAIAIFVAAKAV